MHVKGIGSGKEMGLESVGTYEGQDKVMMILKGGLWSIAGITLIQGTDFCVFREKVFLNISSKNGFGKAIVLYIFRYII